MPATNSDSSGTTKHQHNEARGLSRGTVAGIVIGIAIVAGLITGSIVYLFLRRRHQRNTDATSGSDGFTVVSRQASQMSSAGLLTSHTRANTIDPAHSQKVHRNIDGTITVGPNRTSIMIDQRLDPWAFYPGGDLASNSTLMDSRDYSRQLRISNPDPSVTEALEPHEAEKQRSNPQRQWTVTVPRDFRSN